MAAIYYDAIHRGDRTIDQVPVRWRAQVQALLDADNAETPAGEE